MKTCGKLDTTESVKSSLTVSFHCNLLVYHHCLVPFLFHPVTCDNHNFSMVQNSRYVFRTLACWKCYFHMIFSVCRVGWSVGHNSVRGRKFTLLFFSYIYLQEKWKNIDMIELGKEER